MSTGLPYKENPLLYQLIKGDPDSFTAIYRAYAEDLITWTYNILRDRDTCRDIVHDIFLSLWLKRDTLVITTSLEAYLYTAARYQVFQVIRKGKARESVFLKIEQRIWGEPVAESLVYQKELQERLVAAVNELPDKARDVYRMSREQHLSHKEIAEHLSISVKTVENHLTAALKKIRASMGDLLPLIFAFLNNF
ncbi:MAG: RNA polymerase sigma-70 factor [Candidatus Pseudobacter hemicellulosilyticus]|uniref:RNA polymerase sigma-70 factor n=1 Tax=Candidatus Pseudobacter hemicellulosilyticus TaxID=3121375 RepID=A0AAJ5WRR9_9BACT|nr:MAG: RNA polymerase sigma-70 factor [Pseudobacter sp.]